LFVECVRSIVCLERFVDVQQQTLQKGEELIELARSLDLFHRSLKKFVDYLVECERYLNTRTAIPRRFALYQLLVKQIHEHQSFVNQNQIYNDYFHDLNRLATTLLCHPSKFNTIPIRNSLISIQTRWQRILIRSTERSQALHKIMEDSRNVRKQKH
jgi:dystonin